MGVSAITSMKYRALNRQLLKAQADQAQREKDATARSIADANARAAEATQKAEQERLARVKLEERIAWRSLTAEQQSQIGSVLRRFAGQLALIQYNVNDLEAETFGDDIASALQTADWRVSEPLAILEMREGPVPLGTNPPLETGVTIISTRDQISRDAGASLWHEISVRGFDCTISPQTDARTTPTVFVMVELRPHGPQGAAKLRKDMP